jgi:hypothetical protein
MRRIDELIPPNRSLSTTIRVLEDFAAKGAEPPRLLTPDELAML